MEDDSLIPTNVNTNPRSSTEKNLLRQQELQFKMEQAKVREIEQQFDQAFEKNLKAQMVSGQISFSEKPAEMNLDG